MSWTNDATGLEELGSEALAVLNTLSPMDVPKDTVLFRPGETVKGYVIVLHGIIGVNLVGPTGRDILLYRVQPGQSCIQSTLGLMGGEDYSGEAVAETDACVVLLPKGVFQNLIHASPPFRKLVFAAFAKRMQSMMHLLERVAFQKVESRLAAYIRDNAADGTLRMTQADIATAIGSAREVVSRRLDTLETRGCILRDRGSVTITNPEMLRQMAEVVRM